MILKILKAPHSVLKTMSSPVANVDGKVASILDDMLETMYSGNGVGLAANQVGLTSRILVMDIDWKAGEKGNPYKMVNPEIIWKSAELNTYEEGCLSFPSHYSDVTRPKMVQVKYIDENGNEKLLEADGLLSTCVQHEIDHLDGIVFVDHISRLKRDMILRKMQKSSKLDETA